MGVGDTPVGSVEPNTGVVRQVLCMWMQTRERTLDGSPFDSFYTASYRSAVRTAALITGSVPAAEELVQDAFVDLYAHWDEVVVPAAWLRVAVVRRCRSWQRRRVLERRTRPERVLVADDADGLAVREALEVLTPRQRAAVVLRYFEDLPEIEIAAALGCRPGTVKSLLSRSMTKLEEALAND